METSAILFRRLYRKNAKKDNGGEHRRCQKKEEEESFLNYFLPFGIKTVLIMFF